MIEYKRNLPYILPDNGVFFVIFRINNSLPLDILASLKSEYKQEVKLAKSTIAKSKILGGLAIKLYIGQEFPMYLQKKLTKFCEPSLL